MLSDSIQNDISVVRDRIGDAALAELIRFKAGPEYTYIANDIELGTYLDDWYDDGEGGAKEFLAWVAAGAAGWQIRTEETAEVVHPCGVIFSLRWIDGYWVDENTGVKYNDIEQAVDACNLMFEREDL